VAAAVWATIRYPVWREHYELYVIERKLYQLRPKMAEQEVLDILGPPFNSRPHRTRPGWTIHEYSYATVWIAGGRLIAVRPIKGYQPRPPLYKKLYHKGRNFIFPVRTMPS
jgi:hypothetical protein